jgi:probable HAF family extracellular repeat protein
MRTRGKTLLTVALVLGSMVAPAAPALGRPPGADPALAGVRRYTVTDLGSLGGSGGTAAGGWTLPHAMNDAGLVVGAADTGSGVHAFAWHAGRLADLGTLPGGRDSAAYGVDEAGVVAGTAETAGGESRAVLWRPAVRGIAATGRWRIRDLGLPRSRALAINDRGQVLALTTGADGVTRRVLWQQGAVTVLGREDEHSAAEGDLTNAGAITVRVRGTATGAWRAGIQWYGRMRGSAVTGAAADVNHHGVMVGAAGTRSGVRPFVWRAGGPASPGTPSPGTPSPGTPSLGTLSLGTLGGRDGAATVINDRGVVAGHADTPAGQSRPVLWRDGRAVDLTRRGVRGVDAIVDLNNAGQMIATDGYRALFIG